VSEELERLPEICLSPGVAGAGTYVSGRIANVVLAGAGVSRLAAELVRDLMAETAPVPVLVHTGHTLPAFAGPDTLVVALSYLGTSEETVYVVSDASERRCKVVPAMSGGHLRDIAAGQGFPSILLTGGLEGSAARLAASVFGIQTHLPALRPDAALFGDDARDDREEAIRLLRRQRDAFSASGAGGRTAPGQLAAVLHNRTVVVLASPSLEAVARCWRYWLEADADYRAHAGAFPAVEHEGWLGVGPDSLLRRWDTTVILLRDRFDDPMVSARIEAARDKWHAAVPELPIHEIVADGKSLLARMWTTLYLGAWTAEGLRQRV
jgi:glucose/mannose-6-phosphate isomerase